MGEYGPQGLNGKWLLPSSVHHNALPRTTPGQRDFFIRARLITMTRNEYIEEPRMPKQLLHPPLQYSAPHKESIKRHEVCKQRCTIDQFQIPSMLSRHGTQRHEWKCMLVEANVQAYLTRAAALEPVPIQVRAEVDQSPEQHRLAFSVLPFFFRDLTPQIPAAEQSRNGNLTKWEIGRVESDVVMSAVGEDKRGNVSRERYHLKT